MTYDAEAWARDLRRKQRGTRPGGRALQLATEALQRAYAAGEVGERAQRMEARVGQLTADCLVHAADATERDQLRERVVALLTEAEMYGYEPLHCAHNSVSESIPRGPGVTQVIFSKVPACRKCVGCRVREALGMPADDPPRDSS